MSSEAVVHLIDDDAGGRLAFARMLEAAQFNVRTYESAVAFLKILPNVEPGCIVTDFQMPQIDGLVLIRRLRDLGSNMPVIVISGSGDVSLPAKAVSAGAIGFLEKPLNAELLITWIRSALTCIECSGAPETMPLEEQRPGMVAPLL